MLQRIGLSALLFMGAAAHAQTGVDAPWVRATVAQQTSTGAFMRIRSVEGARLVEVRSPAAKSVEMHTMAMQGDVMRMRQIDGLVLPAGGAVDLAPGGHHLMLVGLVRPLKEGDTVPFTLVVEGLDRKRENVEVTATVRALNSGAGEAAGHVHKH
ncbi:MAG: copper chaperone PCu(A)C [Burkholderiaceae bacterium]